MAGWIGGGGGSCCVGVLRVDLGVWRMVDGEEFCGGLVVLRRNLVADGEAQSQSFRGLLGIVLDLINGGLLR